MNSRAREILWLDAGAGGTVGLLMLVLHAWLVRFYAMSPRVVMFVAVANLAYASYSFVLAALASWSGAPPRRAIDLLVIANATWAAICVVLLIEVFPQASIFGLAHVALEGVFVGALAVVEYRQVRPYAR